MADVAEIVESASCEIQALQYECEALQAKVTALEAQERKLRKRLRNADSWCDEASRLSEVREVLYADWEVADVEHAVQVADDEENKGASSKEPSGAGS